MNQATLEQIAQAKMLRRDINDLLETKKQPVVMSTLALVSAEALASLELLPGVSRENAVETFCAQVAEIAKWIAK
jgi:uncharacterized protein (UPF0276 family)